MGTTSNESKQRWNSKHYTQIKVSVQPEIAEAFKAKCAAAGVSMASEIAKFMSYHNPKKTRYDVPVTTRQQRRKATVAVILQVEAIADAEQEYLNNIPINLQNSERYESAEQAVEALEEALGILNNVYN